MPMANHPSRGLRAAGGLWGPPAPALRGTVTRRFQWDAANGFGAWCRSEHSSAAKGFEGEWTSFPGVGTRLSPASTSRTIRGPSPANLIDATGRQKHGQPPPATKGRITKDLDLKGRMARKLRTKKRLRGVCQAKNYP